MMRVQEGARSLLAYIEKAEHRSLRWESTILERNQWGRIVIKYDLFDRRSSLGKKPKITRVGKFFPDDQGRKTYRFMREFGSILSNIQPSPVLRIPHADFYDAKHRILFQEYVDGKPYSTMVAGRNFKKYLRLAGKALAFLHAQDVAAGKSKFLGGHLRELIHPHPGIFCEKVPELKGTVEVLVKGMKNIEKGWGYKNRMAPIHRDFHMRQLFYGKGRVTLIDWDLFAKGDPALDIGNFVVYLRTHLPKEKLSAIDSFLGGYFSDASSSLLKRVFLYEAFTYLRLACKAFLLKGRRWKDRAEKLLLLSETRLLEQTIMQ